MPLVGGEGYDLVTIVDGHDQSNIIEMRPVRIGDVRYDYVSVVKSVQTELLYRLDNGHVERSKKPGDAVRLRNHSPLVVGQAASVIENFVADWAFARAAEDGEDLSRGSNERVLNNVQCETLGNSLPYHRQPLPGILIMRFP